MRYSTRQYARALYGALAGKKDGERKRNMTRFLRILRANKDGARLNAIHAKTEEEWMKENKITKVEIESASPVSATIKKEIESALGKNLLLTEKVNPDLLAGIKILVNGEDLIDASARRRLDKLFAE